MQRSTIYVFIVKATLIKESQAKLELYFNTPTPPYLILPHENSFNSLSSAKKYKMKNSRLVEANFVVVLRELLLFLLTEIFMLFANKSLVLV